MLAYTVCVKEYGDVHIHTVVYTVVYSHLTASVPSISSGSTMRLTEIKQLLKMNEDMMINVCVWK